LALDIETGQLKWYYQYLPGDDWDLDHIHERTLLRTAVNPDPSAVKWINPNIARGQERDVVVEVGEAGGIWALDRTNGQFLWATPFPLDVPEFHISNIDVDTGRAHINWNSVMKKDKDRILVCFHNTRGYWSTAYHPGKNALYIPYHDACLDMTANSANPQGWGPRRAVMRPGSDPKTFSSIAKVDLSTGRITRIHTQPAPGNGSALVTAGDLLFLGRPQSQVPGVRRRQRQDSLGDRTRRSDPDEHDHLCGERAAVRSGDDRRWAIGHGEPAAAGPHQDRAWPQRDLRVRLAGETLTAQRCDEPRKRSGAGAFAAAASTNRLR